MTTNMMMTAGCRLLAAAVLGVAVSSTALAADEVVIGASLPLSGPLAGFGAYQRWGYETAVKDINKDGGITVDGKKRPVRLVVRDDKTDPNVTASNTESLLSRDKVVAMLGSCTPALVNAGALVAERRKVPLVTGCNPLQAFKSVRKWHYAWSIFFDEPDLASAPFRMMADLGLATNKKIAILADNGPDGAVVGGKLWPEAAKAGGYEVVQNSAFPVDTQQFTAMVAQAKASGAEIVLVDAIPPQAIAMRKQMASAGFMPKLLVMEKGAEPEFFARPRASWPTACWSVATGTRASPTPARPSWPSASRPRPGRRRASTSPIRTPQRRCCSMRSPRPARSTARRSMPPSPGPRRPTLSVR
jgi:branched-chain amino acid transport system substrate-binding protein